MTRKIAPWSGASLWKPSAMAISKSSMPKRVVSLMMGLRAADEVSTAVSR
jgi:hypothetical protein